VDSRLKREVTNPLLGHGALDKADFHKGLKFLEESLTALNVHLSGRTYLVRTGRSRGCHSMHWRPASWFFP